ncbi:MULTISPECIES: hypothetical protein [unclassified Streptomyces]|uniref:hypothetical protein n=1 Tax=Streptomyces sp. NPDC127129 TaxID=3345373 RepID=UPI00363E8A62
MSMRDVRAATRVVGRRTAVRYLAIGVGASLLAACTGNGNGEAKGGSGPDGGSGGAGGGQPTPTATVADRALAAFVRGKWSITSEIGNESPFTYTAVITDGFWTLEYGEGQTSTGSWDMSGGRLSVQVPENLGSGGEGGDTEEAAALNVPATIGDSLSLSLPWQPPGASGTGGGEMLSVDYSAKSGTLRIRHMEGGGMSTHTCTRV